MSQNIKDPDEEVREEIKQFKKGVGRLVLTVLLLYVGWMIYLVVR